MTKVRNVGGGIEGVMCEQTDQEMRAHVSNETRTQYIYDIVWPMMPLLLKMKKHLKINLTLLLNIRVPIV